MSEDIGFKKPAQIYEPGTLDQVRKSIGPIDQAEAARMTKVLGGQVFTEKSAPIDMSKMPKAKIQHYSHHHSSGSEADRPRSPYTEEKTEKKEPARQQTASSASSARHHSDDGLPSVSNRDWQKMDKLMCSPEYKLKPNFGLFNFLRMLNKNSREKLSSEFGEFSLKGDVDHLQSFLIAVKTIIQLAPDTYKAKILNDPDIKFKFLRTAGSWTMRDIKLLYIDLEREASELTVPMMIPFVKAVYKPLITVYYLGESRIPEIIKEVYSDIIKYPNTPKDKLQTFSKEAITDWIYIWNQVIKGLYPLLMRMCSTTYDEYPDFFQTQSAGIFAFLGVTKFDLLLQGKREDPAEKAKKEAEAKKAEEEKKRKEAQKEERTLGKMDDVVKAGFKLLTQLFPDSGFDKLETMPDLYPYFQPIYEFDDGFNLLSPHNPMQAVVVLLKITEDLFEGCRNINFNIEADETLAELPDTLTSAMNDWTQYREELFEKRYAEDLKNFVNQVYTSGDYAKSQYGKKLISNMLWSTKFNFIPNFNFEQIILDRPANDSPYKPLCRRTDYLRSVFTTLARRIDECSKSHKPVLGVQNPWDRYKFDIPNNVSRRLDVLLGAKRRDSETAATNANLIKYTLCVIAVLDWWINNPASPACSCDPKKMYRISDKDGAPIFSVPTRTDQDDLFAKSVKAAIAKHTAGAKPAEPAATSKSK